MRKGPIIATAEILGRFDSRELYTQAASAPENVRRSIRLMRDEEMIHIAEWRRDHRGVTVAVYQWGPGEDAKKPPGKSKKVRDRERARRFRKGLVEMYGRENARKIWRSRNHGGVDVLVIDGKAVYRRGPLGSKNTVKRHAEGD